MDNFEQLPGYNEPKRKRRSLRTMAGRVLRGDPDYSAPTEEYREEPIVETFDYDELRRALLAMNATDSERDNSYEFFYSPESREELYDIGQGIAEYVRTNDIGTICFLDRSARPAYLALTTYWNKEHPELEKPDIRFLNPKGFVSREDVDNGLVNQSDMIMNDLFKQGEIEDIANMRHTDEIISDLQGGLDKSDKKDKPILLFDACIHSGATVTPVVDKFLRSGIENIRIGTVSDNEMRISVPLDLKIMDREPDRVCYPFGKDRMIKKVYGSITSEKDINPDNRAESVSLRKEIERAVTEQWELHHDS